MLRMLDQYKDSTIVRTRNPAIIDGCDLVVDVGSVYDPDRNRYDHHQITFDGTMTTELKAYKTRLSSAGLVYKHFGREVLRKVLPGLSDEDVVTLYDKLYKGFIEHIDGVDNGVEEFALHIEPGWLDGVNPENQDKIAKSLKPNYKVLTGLSGRVSRLNPRWNEPSSPEKENEQFIKAMEITGDEFLDFVRMYGESWLPARSIVQRALGSRTDVHSSGLIVKLECACPWTEHLYDVEEQLGLTSKDKEALYVLYPDGRSGWRIQCVGEKGSKFTNRRSILKEWQGIRDEELSTKSGIEGCIFVHANGFIGGNKTFEGALKMAIRSLPEM
jgi:uncharacterized UPF0160 family protein